MIRKSSFKMFSDQIECVVIVLQTGDWSSLRSKKCKEDDADDQNNCCRIILTPRPGQTVQLYKLTSKTLNKKFINQSIL